MKQRLAQRPGFGFAPRLHARLRQPTGAVRRGDLSGTFALLLLLAHPALAHDRSISYSDWNIHDREVQVSVRLTELDASRLPWTGTAAAAPEEALGRYLVDHLTLSAAGKPCALASGPHELPGAVGALAYEWTLRCPDAGALRIESSVLLSVAPSHLHFVRVQREDGPPIERVLSNAEPSLTLVASDGGSARTTFFGSFALGAAHIVTRYDHAAFVVALLLVAGSVGEAATVVAGFTVAHSLTLGLTVLGSIRPQQAPIGALIGLSVALVAAEDAWVIGARTRVVPLALGGSLTVLALVAAGGLGVVPALTLAGLAVFTLCYFALVAGSAPPVLNRWMIAFVFGLLYGLSFARVLLDAGVPTDQLARALLGFNLGIEAGLLAIVICLWPLLFLATRPHRRPGRVLMVETGSALMFGLGVFWFVTRAYGV